MSRKRCDTSRDGHRSEALAPKTNGKLSNSFSDFLDARTCAILIRLSQNEGEFLATIATCHVPRSHAGLQHGGDLLKKHVARLMSKRVIELFEMIDIKHHYGHAALCPGSAVYFPV